ncbi:type I-C CRISPR-associated protein Cas5c, partial [Desulfovibrio sp. OttesenSCG-928-G15]|nr:type I-C CRISPR-associated protein Cas5c [Desulfovibrio sp. OttesenSCG-928-G15]
VQIKIQGEYACFTRPEMKGERVSYEVPTPSAIRGILEAVHWKPAITWHIDAIHVMRPVRFESIRRNEVANKVPGVESYMKSGKPLYLLVEDRRVQRGALVLRDVEYYVEAHFSLTGKAGPDDNEGKHLDIFNRRLKKGQVYHQPCLGCREFPAFIEAVSGGIPPSALAEKAEGNRNLGWMLYDLDFSEAANTTPMFFQANMERGIVRIPPLTSPEVKR